MVNHPVDPQVQLLSHYIIELPEAQWTKAHTTHYLLRTCTECWQFSHFVAGPGLGDIIVSKLKSNFPTQINSRACSIIYTCHIDEHNRAQIESKQLVCPSWLVDPQLTWSANQKEGSVEWNPRQLQWCTMWHRLICKEAKSQCRESLESTMALQYAAYDRDNVNHISTTTLHKMNTIMYRFTPQSMHTWCLHLSASNIVLSLVITNTFSWHE